MAKEIRNMIEDFRDQIDTIDLEILKLMNLRLDFAAKIAEIKQEQKNPDYYRPEREAQILRRLQQCNRDGHMSDAAIESLFREVMSITRHSESELSVSVLGPPGTYTEAAARKHFGQAIHIIDHPTIDEIFKSTETGATDFSVVPVENSTEGGVTGTLDRLCTTVLTVCGEINLEINHSLLSKSNSLDQVKVIYAHTQSLGQCRNWIERNCSDAERIPVGSNADAAVKVADEPNSAAIASSIAADRYGLKVLVENIEDDPGNSTRFLVLSKRPTPPSGKDKTSLIVAAANKPGSLVELLMPLWDEKVDMTRLESRPSKIGLWAYVFFIDIIGHQDEEHVDRALQTLRSKAGFYKNLGSYPSAV
ncbi:MAG: prephenate dehydratase [Gammaproteobacteria bacterium]|nr:prephenate dehydratase [Gammaproteobacteria bacterium]